MREFKNAMPLDFRAGRNFRLSNCLHNLKRAMANAGGHVFCGVDAPAVHTELVTLTRRLHTSDDADGDLSTHELFLWLLDRRHFIEWQSATEVARGSNVASLRNSFNTLWREASSIVRDNARPLKAPPWRSLSEMTNGKYRPSLLDTPRRGVDTYLLNKINAFHAGSLWHTFGSLDMNAAADEILSSNRTYLAPPNALACLYQTAVAPTLVAPPPNFPYRPKGVCTW